MISLSAAERKLTSTWQRRQKKLEEYSSRLERVWAGHFKAERLRVVNAIRGLNLSSMRIDSSLPNLQAASRVKSIKARIDRAVQPGLKTLPKKLKPVYKAASKATEIEVKMGMTFKFPGFQPAVAKWIDEHVPKVAGDISLTTRKQIMNAVRQGIEKGWSTKQIAGRIQTLYDGFTAARAHRIAQHETAQVASVTEYEMWKGTGASVNKTWRTARDDRVRDLHLIEGESHPFGENFSNGLRFPKDPEGAPENILNCRCFLSYTVL